VDASVRSIQTIHVVVHRDRPYLDPVPEHVADAAAGVTAQPDPEAMTIYANNGAMSRELTPDGSRLLAP
jgi:hypothetical protein